MRARPRHSMSLGDSMFVIGALSFTAICLLAYFLPALLGSTP